MKVALALLASIIMPLGLVGQELSGPLLPVGRLRLEVSSQFLFADERFGKRTEGGSLVEEVEPLGFDFTDAAVGSRLFPGLESLEANLAIATGAAITPLVLGRTQAILTKDAVWIPIRLDVGVFDWLTVGGTVPFSRRRAEFETSFQSDVANVGLTSDMFDDFLGSVLDANAALSAIVTTLCSSGPASPECAQATSLLAEGDGFYGALSDGTDPQGVFPLEGSITGTALQARVTALLTAYQAVGVSSFPTTIPLAADSLRLNEATYLDLVRNSAFGVAGDSLETWRSPWELGDVEVHAYARLWRNTQESSLDGSAPNIRVEIGAGALLRLGTGRTDAPFNFIDTGSGDGQHDLELSVFGTLRAGDRLGIVGDLRYGIQTPVRVLRRITTPDRIFAPLSAEQVVRWNPGDYVQLHVSPRVHLTEEIAIALDFRYFSKKADRYSTSGAGAGLDPGPLELETAEKSLGMGFGVVFSTLRSERGRPMEARFLFRQAVWGRGGAAPKTARFEVGLRFYRGLWE